MGWELSLKICFKSVYRHTHIGKSLLVLGDYVVLHAVGVKVERDVFKGEAALGKLFD